MLDDSPGRELIERAEDLVLRLRDIHSCRILTDETGKIAEVHVVAATNRSPKMIARDVETCLKAELGLPLDYRKIGVVLIDSMKETDPAKRREKDDGRDPSGDCVPVEDLVEAKLSESGESRIRPAAEPRPDDRLSELEFLEEDVRVRFKGLRLEINENRVDVEVKLQKNDLEVVGCLGVIRKSGPIYETIAGATIHALTELLDESFLLCLSGVEEIRISGRSAMLAVVEIIDGRASRSFAGCVFVGQDPNEAAVLSVLDAVNRPLGRWKSHKEIHYIIK